MEVATGCEQANNEAKLASKCFEPHTIAKLKQREDRHFNDMERLKRKVKMLKKEMPAFT